MITFDISLGSLIVGVIGTLLTTLIIYLIREVRILVRLIKRHEKVLFGDPDIEDWNGLVKMCLASKKYSINDRRAFIALISILCRNKIIELDGELTESMELLKKE